jgi:FeS assembly protein IscX
MAKLGWDRYEDIAIALAGKFPDLDPANIRYTDLHKWIVELDEFDDDPLKSSEGKLEAIQMAWLEEYTDTH